MTASVASSRIFVKNLPPSITHDEFQAHFSKLYPTTDAKLLKHRRIGYVGYKSPEEAARAVKYFNKSFIRMSKISAELATPFDENASSKQSRSAHSSSAPNPLSQQAAHNPLKRKRDDAPHSNQDKLNEFLGVMQATAKSQTWQNDVHALPIHSTGTQSGSTTQLPDKLLSNGNKSNPTEVPHQHIQLQEAQQSLDQNSNLALSDSDWLRSRTLLNPSEPHHSDLPTSSQPLSVSESPEDAANENGMASPDEQTDHASHSDTVAKIQKSRRLFIRNLPFTVNQDDLRSHFSTFGQVDEVHIPTDPISDKPKGFAFVLFTQAQDAVSAYTATDGQILHGRLIHVLPAEAKRDNQLDMFAISQLPLKQQQKIKRKMALSTSSKWNPLYMNMDDVMSSVSYRLGVEKSQLVDATSSDAAVKQALAETHVIQESKTFFAESGVDLDAFKPGSTRGDSTILVKNFPYGTTADEIREMFSAYGPLTRCLIPPSGTMALVQFANSSHGRKAFDALKYRRVKNTILFLEKAPEDVFRSTVPQDAIISTKTMVVGSKLSTVDLLHKEQETDSLDTSTLFVRNLNFSTTTDLLRDTFSSLSGFKTARVKTKVDAKRGVLSMGFGFLEFKSKGDAQAAMAAMNGHVLEGHKLDVRLSQRSIDQGEERRKADQAKARANEQTKVIVKNLPFEATKRDVRSLLGAYGQLRSVRVPKKIDGSTRGFAFAEFTTSQEAANAMEALRSTHLLGRRLHIEYAAKDMIDPEEEIAKMQRKVESQVDKVALQKLTKSGRKKFNIGGNEPDS